MPYDQSRFHPSHARPGLLTGYESLSLAQRAGYIAVALFTLFTAIVFDPAM